MNVQTARAPKARDHEPFACLPLLIGRLKEACIDATQVSPGVIRFDGTPDVGWRAAAICIAAGGQIASLRRAWPFCEAGTEPGAPFWEMVFTERNSR